MVLILPASSFAAHPLVTDDTGTLGRSGLQIELSADRSPSKGGTLFSRSIPPLLQQVDSETVTYTTLTNFTVTYGWTNTTDVSLTLPYLNIGANDSGKIHGIGDTGFELKWLFFKTSGFSMALKPQILLPTGSKRLELGNGKASYGTNVLAAYEEGSHMVIANGGYTYNNNVVGARRNLWNLSTAVIWKIVPAVQLTLDIGLYRNPDRSSHQNPAFVIAGLIYSANEKLDFDIGIRKGLNQAEAGHAVGAGLTTRW